VSAAGKRKIHKKDRKTMKINPLIRVLLICLACGIPALSAQDASPPGQPAIAADIRQLLEADDPAIAGLDILGHEIVLQVYADHEFQPYWTDAENIRALISLIDEAPDHGLLPSDYNVDQLYLILSERENNPSAVIDAGSDILLTESLLRYAYHRRLGKITPSTIDPDINYKRQAFQNQPPSKTLHELLESGSLRDFIDIVAPSGPFYKGIQQWLSRYRQLAAEGGWPGVPDGPALRLGDRDLRVALIRERLVVTGELPEDADTQTTFFDEALEQAVITFQSRHALENDGIAGKQTIAAMNVSVEERINQLRVSLERIRWVNQEAVQTFVAVNIASFQAYMFRNGELEWSTRAMVGRDYRRTPIFRGDIQYMEFNPTWTIPPTILRNDTLPAIKKDPGYLSSKNIRVIDSNGHFVDPSTVDWNQYSKSAPYTFRQDPGPDNALGVVKFIFPNRHSVFLHDTPHRELFSRPERAFSSGCIRIEDPLKLAELLLTDEHYAGPGFQAIIDSGKTQRIYLAKPVPVIILYLTTGLDSDGNILFYKDIYNKDMKVLEALNGPVVLQPPVVEQEP